MRDLHVALPALRVPYGGGFHLRTCLLPYFSLSVSLITPFALEETIMHRLPDERNLLGTSRDKIALELRQGHDSLPWLVY